MDALESLDVSGKIGNKDKVITDPRGCTLSHLSWSVGKDILTQAARPT
jgi:hypothetical protein